jgi:uroporphyrinogen-III synthase
VSEASLAGVRVVVTRAPHQAGALGRLLVERGAEVLYVPVIEIAPPQTWDAIDAVVRRAARHHFRWVVFTSANSVPIILGRPSAPDALRATRVAAVGPATAAALENLGRPPDLVPQEHTAVAVAAALGPGPGRVLLPRAEGAPSEIVDALRAAGWTPEEVGAYRNVVAGRSESAREVETGNFDAVTFTSSSTARSFAVVVGPPEPLGLGPTGAKVVACIGPATAADARAVGYGVDVVALEHSAPGLVDALAAHMGRSRMAP